MKYPNDYINKIICGDCLEVMKGIPDKSVDLVLTDPPYGIGEMVSGTQSKARLHKTRYDTFIDNPEYIKRICVPVIELCLQKAKAVILTPGSRCMHLYPPPTSFGCLYSNSSSGMQMWGAMDSQPIFYYGKPYDIGKRIHKCSYEVHEQPSDKRHPCSKPIKLWEKIVLDRTSEGMIILDPFIGSGTTAVACKNLGRKYIGIEISPEYCKIAEDRLRQEVLF